jgi:hypothetical protein
MQQIGVDTSSLASAGQRVSGLGSSLGSARAAVNRIQDAAGAAGSPDVEGAIEALVLQWGSTVVALQDAALGLGRNARAAAGVYEVTDAKAIPD